MSNNTEKNEKKENRSLFLYTSLIFLVAILVIVISFASQKNFEKQHNEVIGENSEATSISEKTAQISEENMILIQTTKDLNEQNSELTSKNWELNEKISLLESKLENNDKLCEIFNDIQNKDKETASSLFEELDTTHFTTEQEKFYNYLQEQIRAMK